ncbi:Hpt domain-containing protein [Malikia spinosa]|uniref:Hpt domain-containing protein n=1 Tax=Malikia spinosa TaxID=86180 RepID=A0A7C9IZL3_9BURK|nr:Hpt domain-containing protein [Malikia spinosa]MYZ54054.1 Hpt domain-containing protein [Malikia spinosa]
MDSVARPVRSENLMAPDSAGTLPVAIDGLDLPQMRLRLGCDDQVLLKILRQFLCDFGSWWESFEIERKMLNTDAMMHLVHTLKGTAANVCANQVQATALALETALRQGVGQVAGLALDCDVALQQVLTALRRQLPPEAGPGLNQMAPTQALLVVQEVAALLQRRRHVPHRLQQELRTVVAPFVSTEQFNALLYHLAAFEFKNAQQVLADIQGHMSA